MNLSRLLAEFPRDAVHWRVQGKPFERDGKFSALALAYIDARDVMDRLDEVCGPENWQSEFTETAKGRVLCRIGIKLGDAWVWKTDGAGDTDVEGEKGAISDALKRAAVHWGIGRYLYGFDAVWVPCEVKDGKWRKWAVNPWDRVSAAPAATSKPAFNPAAAADRVIAKMQKAAHFGALREAWTVEQPTIAEIHAASPADFERVVAAKNKRQQELDPALQSPELNQEEAA